MSAADEPAPRMQNVSQEAMPGETAQNQSLLEQRLMCRAQLAKQRQVIAFQLTPKLALTHKEVSAAQYPRSLMMRFLTQNPGSAYRLILPVATMLIGARTLGVLSTGLQIYKMFRAR